MKKTRRGIISSVYKGERKRPVHAAMRFAQMLASHHKLTPRSGRRRVRHTAVTYAGLSVSNS